MAESTLWWLLAGTAIGVELLTGTFYLLMLSLGLAAAALAAHAGAPITLQIVVAAVVGAGAVMGWRAYRLSRPASAPANANHDVNLDIGETVHVESWGADGSAQVKYRGANWSVALAGSTPMSSAAPAGTYRVVQIVGSRLMVEKV